MLKWILLLATESAIKLWLLSCTQNHKRAVSNVILQKTEAL